MKKGFTLIELLAVIVILAIIALIATPIVLNIIEEAKDSASLRSAEFYLDAIEQSILMAELDNRRITDGKYNVLETGNICLEYDNEDKCIDELVIEVKGEKPNNGTITITKGKIEDILLNLNDKEIVKNDNGSLEIEEPLKEEEADIDDSLICKLISGEEKEIGSKYECEVKPGTKYNFYVLSKEEDKLNLIMERNICEDGTVATVENQCFVAWITPTTHGCGEGNSRCARNDKGPVTAMTHLYNATKDWSNIPSIKISYVDENMYGDGLESGDGGYGGLVTIDNVTIITDKEGNETARYENLKSRLPKYSEVSGENKCLFSWDEDATGSCPLWLVDYLRDDEYSTPYYNSSNGKTSIQGIWGYWTLSSGADSDNSALFVINAGTIELPFSSSDAVGFDFERGVRPVITIPKSNI